MTTYNRKFHPCRWLCCYLVAALPLLLAACTADDSIDSAATSLTIGVTEQPWQTEDISITRSGETLTALQASGFGLYSAGLGISNEQVTWSDTKWALAHTLIWPKTRPNDFYAYAPYAADPDITNGVYTFSCPNNNTTDLLYGQYASTTGDVVNLQFHHALAKLVFNSIANSSARDMLVSDIKVTGDLYSSGKLTLSTGAWAEQVTASGQTIQIIPDNKFIYVPAQGENPVRSSVSPLLIPEPTVTVSYEVYNEGTDMTECNASLFHNWNGWTGSAEANNDVIQDGEYNYIDGVGKPLHKGDVIIGTSTVWYKTFADITAYDKIVIVGTPELKVRVLLNRQEGTGTGGDGGTLIEKSGSINSDGYLVIDLSDITDGYKHLNAIKVQFYDESVTEVLGTVTKVLLVKTTHPHTVSGTTVLEQGKEKTFHLKVGVNHEVVIED